jgi:hypothetical protein
LIYTHYKGLLKELKTDGRGDTTNNDEVAKAHIVKIHICSKCYGKFASKQGLMNHFKIYHVEATREKNIPCPHPGCEKKFERQCILSNHWKDTHATPTLKCQSCPGLYRTRAKLNQHIKRVHKKVPYICALCGMSFNNTGGINLHKKLSHANHAEQERQKLNAKLTAEEKTRWVEEQNQEEQRRDERKQETREKAITAKTKSAEETEKATATARARAATNLKKLSLRRLNNEDIFEDNYEEYEAVSNVVKTNEITCVAINCNSLLGSRVESVNESRRVSVTEETSVFLGLSRVCC